VQKVNYDANKHLKNVRRI